MHNFLSQRVFFERLITLYYYDPISKCFYGVMRGEDCCQSTSQAGLMQRQWKP